MKLFTFMTKTKSSIFTHISRTKKSYYIHQRTTKTGKITYYLSPKEQGNIVEKIPKGYEIYDHPETNQAFIRPIQPKIISDEELKTVKNCMNKSGNVKHYRIDIQKNAIVVYTAENQKPISEVFANLFNISEIPEINPLAELLKNPIPDFSSEIDEMFLKFHPMLRFILIDKEKRVFAAQRWCFSGATDDWMGLFKTDYLKELCKLFVPHLSKESFYELPF